MIIAILLLRFRQIQRISNDLGLGRFIFMILMMAMIGFLTFTASTEKKGASVITLVLILLILIVHFKRKDLSFLRNHVEGFRKILIIEYLLIGLPAIISMMIHLRFYESIVIIISLIAITNLNQFKKSSTLNTWFQRQIPDMTFEWKSGIRRSIYYILPLWIAGLLSSFWIGSIPIVIVIIGLILFSFNEKHEPLHMLNAFELGARKLIFFKISNQLKLYAIICLPLLMVFLIQHFGYWYIPAAFFAIFSFLLTYSILTKYTFYQPNGTGAAQQIFNAIGAVSAFIPFLLPVIMILVVNFYFKSIRNLNQYLYDYN